MRKIVSRGASKDAALYFDVVFPNDLMVSSLGAAGVIDGTAQQNCIPFDDVDYAHKICRSLMPGVKDPERAVFFANTLDILDFVVQGAAQGVYKNPEDYYLRSREALHIARQELGLDLSWSAICEDFSGALDRIRRKKSKIEREAGFSHTPDWISESVLSKAKDHLPITDEPLFALSLKGLNLVDAEKLSWDQIIEFRKDKESRSALRQLRLFFQDELKSKDLGHITDKLGALAEEQEKAARLWGFETLQKSLSVAFTHKSVLATSAAGLAAGLAGAPLTAAAAATMAVPLGSFSLEFARALIDSAKVKAREPTKYLTMLKKLGKDADGPWP
jgi:hypothetical protein